MLRTDTGPAKGSVVSTPSKKVLGGAAPCSGRVSEIAAAPRLGRVSEVAQYLSLSKAMTYKLISMGLIPTIRLGEAIRVDWLVAQRIAEQGLPSAASAGSPADV